MREYFYKILPEIQKVLKWIIPQGRGYNLSVSKRGKLSFLIFIIYRKAGFFDHLWRLTLHISQNPSLKVEDIYRTVNIHRAKYIRPYDYEKFLIMQSDRDIKLYSHISSITTNTPENRFLAFFVDRILYDLKSLIERFRTSNFTDEINEAKRILQKFQYIRNFTFLKNFAKFPSFAISERIIHNPIYAKIFNMFLNYSGYILMDKEVEELDKMLEDWRIFELYVLFNIKWFFDEIYGASLYAKISPFYKELRPDAIFKDWRYKYNNGTYLYYQLKIPKYSRKSQKIFSSSLNLRPDIIVRINNDFYIFDAKYKNSPEDNDYRQMHTYRDAIRMRVNGKPRRIVRFAIMVVKDKEQLYNLAGWDVLSEWNYIKKARVGYITVTGLKDVLQDLFTLKNVPRSKSS